MDHETFAQIYCAKLSIRCGNLGRSGTGTTAQLNILEHYLEEEKWRPKEVKLFMLAMIGSLLPGNDLFDNYFSHLGNLEQTGDVPEGVSTEKLNTSAASSRLKLRDHALRWSNLMRAVYFTIGPWARTLLAPAPNAETLNEALKATKVQFSRLAEMARRYGFQYKIYILHPVQDILRGTSATTLSTLQTLAKGAPVVSTAPALHDSAASHYFPYDGHFNVSGSRKIAEFLLKEASGGV